VFSILSVTSARSHPEEATQGSPRKREREREMMETDGQPDGLLRKNDNQSLSGVLRENVLGGEESMPDSRIWM